MSGIPVFSMPCMPGNRRPAAVFTTRRKAKRPDSDYRAYPNYGTHTARSHTQSLALRPVETKEIALEWVLRDCRTIAFADATGLTPIEYTDMLHGELLRRVRDTCCLDHSSIWVSPADTVFVLNEAYNGVSNKYLSIQHEGLLVHQLPINISPYCGRWTSTPTEPPGTRSYLICDKQYAVEFNAIIKKLERAAKNAPAWNDTSEVRRV